MIARRHYDVAPGELGILLRHAIRPWVESSGTVALLEARFSEILGNAHCIAFDLGRHALLGLLEGFSVRPGDVVLLPACSFKGLPEVLACAGFRVAFMDLPDGEQAGDNCTPGVVRAAVPVHLFGYPTDWGRQIERWRAAGIVILEDCAHGPGMLRGSREVGGDTDGALFSLNALKPVNAYLGGLAVTRSDVAARRIRSRCGADTQDWLTVLQAVVGVRAQNLLFDTPLYGPVARLFGHPVTSRLLTQLNDGLLRERSRGTVGLHPALAAIALAKLATLWARIDRRLAIARRYDEALGMPCAYHDSCSPDRASGYFYPVRAQVPPGQVRRAFLSRGVDVGILHEVVDFLPGADRAGEFPVAWGVHQGVVQVPLHERLTSGQVEKVCVTLSALAKAGLIRSWHSDGS